MKAKVVNAKRAVELYIEFGRSYGLSIENYLESFKERGHRDPYARTLQEIGFDLHGEIEVIPGVTKVAPKEVLKKWVEERIFVMVDEESSPLGAKEEKAHDSAKIGEKEEIKKGMVYEGNMKMNNSAHSPIPMKVWWNGKYYDQDTVFLTVYHGKSSQNKVVLSRAGGIVEAKMARQDCHLAAANKGVFEKIVKRLWKE